MRQDVLAPQPVTRCHFCNRPWYGLVSFCPYCGAKATEAQTPASADKPTKAVPPKGSTPVSSEKIVLAGSTVSKDLPPKNHPSEESAPKAIAGASNEDQPKVSPTDEWKAVALAAEADQDQPRRDPIQIPRPSWGWKLAVVAVLAGVVAWWYPKAPPQLTPGPIPMPAPPGKTVPNKPPQSPTPPPAQIVSTASLEEVLSLFPLEEGRRYLTAMLDGARSGNDAATVSARRQLQGIVLPPRGDRKVARAENKVGLDAMQRSEWQPAVSSLLVAAKTDPADQEVINNLSFALYKADRLGDARSVAFAALTLAPERTSAWANLAMVFAKEGKIDDAVSAFLLSRRYSQNPQKTAEFLQKLVDEDPSALVRDAANKAQAKIAEIEPATALPVPRIAKSTPVPTTQLPSTTDALITGMLEDGESCMVRKKYDCAISSAKAALRVAPASTAAKTLLHRAEFEQQKAMESISIN